MSVSPDDREYMQRIGRYKADSHQAALDYHRSLPLSERLARSWALFEAMKDQANLDARIDDPTPFYDRARALGMYRTEQ